MNYSKEQIKEIAEMLGCGNHVCYANPDTGEIEIILDDEMLDINGISWEEDEEEEIMTDESAPVWQDELYAEVKAQMKRINSWERFTRIEKPTSNEAYRFMERFIDEALPEGTLKERLWKTLSRRHPFQSFNTIIHGSEHREEWFAFRQEAMEEYVRRKLGCD